MDRRLSRLILVVMLACLTACGSASKYLGTNQPGYAKNACKISETKCPLFHTGLDQGGNTYVISGSYSIDSLGDGNYVLSGSVTLSHGHPFIRNIKSLDLIIIALQGDLVIHEEKVRVRGEVDEALEFSKGFATETAFDSSAWAGLGWSANELE